MPSGRMRRSEPNEVLSYLVKQAYRRLSALSKAALEPVGIDVRELGALTVLAGRQPLSQQEVAASLGVDRTTMVAVIDSLEAHGIVTREPDPADRRRNIVRLTAAGHAVYRDADAARIAAEEEFLAPLSRARAEHFRRALSSLLTPDRDPAVNAEASSPAIDRTGVDDVTLPAM